MNVNMRADNAELSVSPTPLADAIVLRTRSHRDDRGVFRETFVASKYTAAGITDTFVQDNLSVSALGVVRGLHSDPCMSKFVQVLRGEAFDVIVDARRESQTFGKWYALILSDTNDTQLYIPAGFLHGFLALTDGVIFSYKQSAEYDPGREVAVSWNDPDLGIKWPLDGAPTVSAKDRGNPRFKDVFPR